MKATVQTWLSILRTYASTRGAYWRALPLRSLRKVLVAAFITGCGIGFVIDLFLLNYRPLGLGFFWPVYLGTVVSAILWARIKSLRLVPVLQLMTLVGLRLAVRVSFHSPVLPDPAAMHRRGVLDAIGILAGTLIGYRLLVVFIRTEGLATVRMQTELALAHGIQATLVPTLSFQVGRFEVYGESIPSTRNVLLLAANRSVLRHRRSRRCSSVPGACCGSPRISRRSACAS